MGIRIFSSLEEAQEAGFVMFERLPDGYLVRKDSGTSFALAIVKFKKHDSEPSPEHRTPEHAQHN